MLKLNPMKNLIKNSLTKLISNRTSIFRFSTIHNNPNPNKKQIKFTFVRRDGTKK
jgi:hypothetical protein